MAIVKWDPFETFLGVQDDLNKLFRNRFASARPFEGGISEVRRWAPAVDIYETEENLVVEAELPGIDPKDIDVTIEDGVLTLKGERKYEKEVKEENYYRIERASGHFERSVRLPFDTDEDSVKAAFDNGVLTVNVPKVQPPEKKSISVEVAGKPKEEKKK